MKFTDYLLSLFIFFSRNVFFLVGCLFVPSFAFSFRCPWCKGRYFQVSFQKRQLMCCRRLPSPMSTMSISPAVVCGIISITHCPVYPWSQYIYFLNDCFNLLHNITSPLAFLPPPPPKKKYVSLVHFSFSIARIFIIFNQAYIYIWQFLEWWHNDAAYTSLRSSCIMARMAHSFRAMIAHDRIS